MGSAIARNDVKGYITESRMFIVMSIVFWKCTLIMCKGKGSPSVWAYT
jgi:hypothetical protein